MFEGWGAAAAAAAVVGGVVSSSSAASAAKTAANAQTSSDNASIAEQDKQFTAIQNLLAPYVNAGTSALTQQGNIAGTNGAAAQQAAYSAIQQSPAFTSAQQLGNTAILQNASATGGLRGGNVQGALAQFSPALLASTINDQYSRLGNLSTMGANAAAGVGNAGQTNANNVSSLLQSIGASQAGNALAQGNAQTGYANAISNGIGVYAGLGGLRSTGSNTIPVSSSDPYGYLSGNDVIGNFGSSTGP